MSYGVAKQAILTTNEERLGWIFRNVIYGPYLTLFGQIPSEIDSKLAGASCGELMAEWLKVIMMGST